MTISNNYSPVGLLSVFGKIFENCGNYNSLLSVASKMFEKSVNNMFVDHLTK